MLQGASVTGIRPDTRASVKSRKSRMSRTARSDVVFLQCVATHLNADPDVVYDVRGFPPELYQVKYEAVGDRALAEEVAGRIRATPALTNEDWGYDHGTWAVLTHMYPAADIPVIQLSINYAMPPEQHFELGRDLAFLRDAGDQIAHQRRGDGVRHDVDEGDAQVAVAGAHRRLDEGPVAHLEHGVGDLLLGARWDRLVLLQDLQLVVGPFARHRRIPPPVIRPGPRGPPGRRARPDRSRRRRSRRGRSPRRRRDRRAGSRGRAPARAT